MAECKIQSCSNYSPSGFEGFCFKHHLDWVVERIDIDGNPIEKTKKPKAKPKRKGQYGFLGTECKIEGCSGLVWPSKSLGYCNKHYQRYHSGSMAEDGSLIKCTETRVCPSCGAYFEISGGHVIWCPACRKEEYRKAALAYYYKNKPVYPEGRKPRAKETKPRKRPPELIIRDWQIVEMRNQGKPIKDICLLFGLTRSSISLIIKKRREVNNE